MAALGEFAKTHQLLGNEPRVTLLFRFLLSWTRGIYELGSWSTRFAPLPARDQIAPL